MSFRVYSRSDMGRASVSGEVSCLGEWGQFQHTTAKGFESIRSCVLLVGIVPQRTAAGVTTPVRKLPRIEIQCFDYIPVWTAKKGLGRAENVLFLVGRLATAWAKPADPAAHDDAWLGRYGR